MATVAPWSPNTLTHMASNETVLVAYDGSESSKAAISDAARLFAERPLLVLSVGRSMAAVASASVAGIPAGVAGEALARLDEEAQREADELAEEGAAAAVAAGLQATGRGAMAPGSIWATILEVADEEDVAAVVVGSRGRSDVKSILLGSVSNGVIHHADCPVVVVRGGSVKASPPSSATA